MRVVVLLGRVAVSVRVRVMIVTRRERRRGGHLTRQFLAGCVRVQRVLNRLLHQGRRTGSRRGGGILNGILNGILANSALL